MKQIGSADVSIAIIEDGGHGGGGGGGGYPDSNGGGHGGGGGMNTKFDILLFSNSNELLICVLNR